MQSLLQPQDMNLFGAGWWWYYAGIIMLALAALSCIGALILLVGRQKTAAGSVGGFAFLMVVAGSLAFFLNLSSGHERFNMIHDLEQAGWTVVSVDESKDSAIVVAGHDQREVILVQTGLDQTWTAFQRCQIRTDRDSTIATVNLSDCAYVARSS